MKARIRQLTDRHRSKLTFLGDAAIIFGTIAVTVGIPGLAPAAAMVLAVYGYCKGQANGYAAGWAAGEGAGRTAEAQRVIDQVQATLARAGLAECEERIVR